ncbi:iron-containing alcohol dehydrogenase [Pontivivens ytuae]|uniref:Iron-containing alcohol dehydrogenase n=1 Tax=Pontivivens ytuae TaxID=2789856 RepID=A0A7S9LQQ2_9RHOB|nr:iron-containing alcohol dehydrogenase [Pontivivens ytuae]QPH53551.1 iron-containing alcohol dehydrogenase [Pontivivens ytuae]
MFDMGAVPRIQFGAGQAALLPEHVASFGARDVTLIADPFLMQGADIPRVVEALRADAIRVRLFHAFSGEPKAHHVAAAADVARGSDLVIGIGGGSALDVAKLAATLAGAPGGPMDYALGRTPLPAALPKIMVPTTAGTGSETSATNIFSSDAGEKLWIWGPQTRAELVILDPALTVSLPPHLTAWCGLDALVHAFEAATNRNAHAGAAPYALDALRHIAWALPRAVAWPDDMEARSALLIASCHAGIAIDACGTAVAHNLSHALARFAPVHHGHATAHAFAASLPWLIEASTPQLRAAAAALDCALSDLPERVEILMGAVDLGPLPQIPVTPEALIAEMQAEANAPMLRNTVREVTPADLHHLAEATLARAA